MLLFVLVGVISLGLRYYFDPATSTVTVFIDARWEIEENGRIGLAPASSQPGAVLVDGEPVDLEELGGFLLKRRQSLKAWGLRPKLDVKYNLGIQRRGYLHLIIAEKIAGFEHVTKNYITTKPESIEQLGE